MKYDEICRIGDRPREGGESIEEFWHVRKNAQYAALFKVLLEAYRQASDGKGSARHASGEPFEDQPIMTISRQVGDGFCLGQAVKKIFESRRLEKTLAVRELHGAIVYLSAAVLLREEQK